MEKEKDDMRKELMLLKDAAACCGTAGSDQELQGAGGDDQRGQATGKEENSSAKELDEKDREISRLTAEVERRAGAESEQEREREEIDREKWNLQASVVKVSAVEGGSLKARASTSCISWGEGCGAS